MSRYLVLSDKDGKKQLTLYDNGEIVPKVNKIALTNFSEAIQSAFKNESNGTKINCDPNTGLKPHALKLIQEAGVADHQQRQNRQTWHAPTRGGRAQTHQNTTTVTIISLSPGRNDNANIHLSDGSQQPAERLGLADQVLGTQTNTTFSINGNTRSLRNYAPAIQNGLGEKPDINKNPYNFAEWSGKRPWEPWTEEEREIYSTQITHEQEHAKRLSGCIEVTLTAQSPVFIPHSSSEDGELTSDFFKAHDGSKESYAIPGSSFKGVVRSLFESLTNSRFGVSNEEILENPPLYRRRATSLFKIKKLPTPLERGIVVKCKYDFLDNRNTQVKVNRRQNQLSGNDLNAATKIDWQANLFHVPQRYYRHNQKTKLAYLELEETYSIDWNIYQAYQGMFKLRRDGRYHHHLEEHIKNAALFNAYNQAFLNKPAEEIREYIKRLKDLTEGDIVFGITQNTQLICFGKNVNFLWPGKTNPKNLMGEFLQREQKDSQLDGSDMAEAVFGFIGDDGKKNGSHSFKGRVRFTPLWAQGTPEVMPEVQLMPLTSPSGTKLKARPLYLKPSTQYNGLSADYSDQDTALKGRKFYWHQQAPDGQTIAKVHDYNQMKQENGPRHSPEMLPKPIRPLPAQTVFKGEVHFSNLSKVELGALLTALNPELAFQNGNARYGLKIGKGKPRGLGSVRSALTVSTLKPAKERYQTFESEPFTAETDLQPYIAAYKEWCQQKSDQSWGNLPFVQDLKKLLQLPDAPSVRVYPPKFDMFGWMPEFDSAQGELRGNPENRPKAMKSARDINV